MSLQVNPGPLKKEITLPGSKSYGNRALILAAIKEAPFIIKHLPDSSDVSLLVQALKGLGLEITKDRESYTVQNSFPACETVGKTLEVGEGGTTARFLASLLLLGKCPYTLKLGVRLKQRPWQEFLDLVNRYGGEARLIDDELFIKGPLILPDEIGIDCSRTTQFASGLQLAFSMDAIKIRPINMNSSQSYWQMTEELIQLVKAQNSFAIPLDWSSASYALAFGALNHPITFPGLKYDPFQSDAKFISILKRFGSVREEDHSFTVSPSDVQLSLKEDVSDCLDLVPALAFFLAHKEGRHELQGIKNLIFKESDRLHEVQKLLEKFDRRCQIANDSLVIHGKQERLAKRVELQLPEDHRMVMTGTLFLRHHAGGTITSASAVQKSYPAFFTILET